MCGIIARVGNNDAINELLTGLDSLEYRGYDSVGVAIQSGTEISVHKKAGEVSEIRQEIKTTAPSGDVGIGHTRWSTHGPPTDANAHPHTSQTGSVAVVHNGIIENHQQLRERLQEQGHEFTSGTDTEVIPHLIEQFYEQTGDTETAFRRAVSELEGSYAIAALIEDEDRVYAARSGSPLVLGIGDEGYYLASDIPAFLEHTSDVVYLEDGDIVVLEPDDVRVTDQQSRPVDREVETIEWDPDETGKGEYDHYMLKEIHGQPTSLSNTIQGRLDVDAGGTTLEEFDTAILDGIKEVQFVACGTSYHAALLGVQLFNEAGIRARAFRASEYDWRSGPISEQTLVVAVTQSGETADTLSAMRIADERGASTLAVTNVVGSTAARESDEAIYIRAGPEIGVAATKTFSSQAVVLAMLSQAVASELATATPRENVEDLVSAMAALPANVEQVIKESRAAALASELLSYDAHFFIGRGLNRPVALEGALKFKEITYEHAEGFASGQLKHGPLALVTPNTTVFALFTGEETDKTITNAKEAQTRGADIVAIAPEGHPGVDIADAHLSIPDTHPICQSLLANVQLQLVAYHTADQLGRPIDKPRNLAKSVTVE